MMVPAPTEQDLEARQAESAAFGDFVITFIFDQSACDDRTSAPCGVEVAAAAPWFKWLKVADIVDDVKDLNRQWEAIDAAADTTKAVDGILPTPQVGSKGLQNHIDALYKGTTNPNRVGNGTTMDAIRNELATGVPTANKIHTIKGQERLRGLNKWLRRNPDAPHSDRLVAQSLADELSLVLRGAG